MDGTELDDTYSQIRRLLNTNPGMANILLESLLEAADEMALTVLENGDTLDEEDQTPANNYCRAVKALREGKF